MDGVFDDDKQVDANEQAIDVLAWSRDRIGAVPGLSKRQTVDYRSSLRVIGTCLDPNFPLRSTTSIVTSPDVLERLDALLRAVRRDFPHLHAQESRARKAVQAVGIDLLDGRGRQALQSAWRRFLAALTSKQREILLLFVHWANLARLDPPDIDDTQMERFAVEYLVGRNGKSATQVVRRISDIWNEVATARGTPPVANPIPRVDRGWYAVPEADFNLHLIAQLDKAVHFWTTVPRRGRRLSAKVAAHRRYQILLIVSAYCHATGVHPSQIHSLEEFLDAH